MECPAVISEGTDDVAMIVDSKRSGQDSAWNGNANTSLVFIASNL